jgi:hypothetical protein
MQWTRYSYQILITFLLSWQILIKFPFTLLVLIKLLFSCQILIKFSFSWQILIKLLFSCQILIKFSFSLQILVKLLFSCQILSNSYFSGRFSDIRKYQILWESIQWLPIFSSVSCLAVPHFSPYYLINGAIIEKNEWETIFQFL